MILFELDLQFKCVGFHKILKLIINSHSLQNNTNPSVDNISDSNSKTHCFSNTH